jgi:outer membrane receptor protein involved in Fe transport
VSFQNFDGSCSFSRTTVVFLIFTIIFANPAFAQVVGGTLSGTVSDPSGAGIPQAKLVIKNVATGVERTVTTNTDGFYTTVNLPAGNYALTISANGFSTETSSGITMTIGAQLTYNTILRVGKLSNRVEVTAQVPDVQLTSSEISAVVTDSTVRELPLNGRSWTDLAALQAGVSTIQTQPSFATGSDRGNRGFGQQLTISGARPQQNNYRLDGVSLNDYANGAPGSVLGGNLGVDAIQEFSVLTSNYSAEYGKTSGGVVNAITRSGTNNFHGSAYEFLRNSVFDARNYFEDPTLSKAPFKRNQFGGEVGGPIIQNKTFFFVDYEGIRQAKSIPNLDVVPSPEARSGLLHFDPTGPPPSGCTPTSTAGQCMVTVDPAVNSYLALYPIPTSCGSDTCNFIFNGNQVVNENYVTARGDHRFSDKDSLFGTYLYDRTPYTSPDSFGNVGLSTLSSRQIVAVEEAHSFTSTFVNAVRFGYNHEHVDNDASVTALKPAAMDTSLGAFAGRNAAVVNVNGLSSMSGGLHGLPTYLYRWNSFQIYDDGFFNRGKHSIKFGGAYEKMLLQVTALTDPNGIWFFNSLPDFLVNNPTKFQGGIASSLTPRNLRQSIYGVYIQDDWRWKSNVTWNLGLRYEMSTVPTETDGKIANLRQLTDALPVCGTSATNCSGTGPFFYNPTYHNFEPRLGFSWDPLKTGKMAVRGGIGLFDVLPLPYQFILLTTQAAPFFEYTALKVGAPVPANCPPGTILTFPLVDPCLISPNKLRSTYVESHPNRNYVSQWNLNVQYQLTPNLAAMIAYVGSRGVHQPFRVDEANLVLPAKTSAGYVWPFDAGGNPLDPLNTHYGSIRGMFYQGRSYYNAMELQLAKRMSHGFQVQGTFTWGKSTDTSSATVAGDAFGNSISSLDWFDMKLTRGLSDFNVGRTFVVNGTWDLPSPKSWTGIGHWLASGWELGLIFTASDGVPFTPTYGTGGDPANTNSSDDYAFPNRLRGPGCGTAVNPGNPTNYIRTQCFALPTAPTLDFWNANCVPNPPNLGSTITDPMNPPPTASGASLPALVCFNLRGNSGRNTVIGPGITGLDFSVFKNIPIKKISEAFNMQFRVEMFNIINHPNFAPPQPGDGNTDIFAADGSPLTGGVQGSVGSTAGQLIRTTIPERQIQFALKFTF